MVGFSLRIPIGDRAAYWGSASQNIFPYLLQAVQSLDGVTTCYSMAGDRLRLEKFYPNPN